MPSKTFVVMEDLVQSSVPVENVSTLASPQNNGRSYCLLVDDSDEVMYITFDKSASLHEGIRINANGGSYEMSMRLGNMSPSPIYAIHGGTGPKTLLVTEAR